MSQSDGPPDLPDDGDSRALVAAERGLALRSATGRAGWGLLPGGTQRLTSTVSGAVAAVSGLSVGIATIGFLGVRAAVAGAGAGAAVWWLTRALVGPVARLAGRLGSRRGSLAEAKAGARIQVLGTVRARGTFKSAVSGRPAVVAHYAVLPDVGTRRDLVRGVDFEIETADGLAVTVGASDLHLTAPLGPPTFSPTDFAVLGRPGPDHPTQRLSFWQRQSAPAGQLPAVQVAYREALLAPGDAVEAVGVLVREVHPDAPADGAGRSPRLRLRLEPGRLLPVMIRKA
jgi:hypothetical protein